MELDPAAAAAGVRLITADSVGSTNTEALLQARAGVRGPVWLTASEQTAGRGRRGRPFVSARGNLFATLLLTELPSTQRAAELSFVAAVALHDALVELAPSLAARLGFKWPNDVISDGAKLAGILVEGESTGPSQIAAVIGIGVNCTSHPAGMTYPATDLATAGIAIAPERLFPVLSRTMLFRLAEWDLGRGFGGIRAAWLVHATGLGEAIRVSLPERVVEGRFESLDASGRLLLRHHDGKLETITAADVFPLGAAAPSAAGQQAH